MNKFKRGDKVIDRRIGDIGIFEYCDEHDRVFVEWVTGDCAGQSLFVYVSDIEHLIDVPVVPEDEVTPTEIMYKGKIYVLKGE